MTIDQALVATRKKLGHVSDAADLDAQWLLSRVFGNEETSWLYSHGETELSGTQSEDLNLMVERRAGGEPLAYILGEWEFYGRKFYINKDVLVPRPATELLVEEALRTISMMTKEMSAAEEDGSFFSIADVGTGSGCIVVTLILELAKIQPRSVEWRWLATDVSEAALSMARKNARRHGVIDKVDFIKSNMAEFLSSQKVDLIVSNPPYVPTEELSDLPTVETAGLRFEPRIALDGGSDGQQYIKELKDSSIPAIVEGTDGKIQAFNFKF